MDNTELGMGRWELHDELFSVDHMYHFVEKQAIERNYVQTQKALRMMKKYHEGQFRKGKDHLPYIVHPLMMACHAFAMEIDEDNLISAILLHDVVEDCDVTVDELDMPQEVKTAVDLVSFKMIEGKSKEESKNIYYEKIGQNRLASMVKLLDRCNNVATMSVGFTKERIAQYIDETERYILPILNYVKHTYPEYKNATFLLKYQMRSVIETIKHVLSE